MEWSLSRPAVLVACGSSKLSRASRAGDLYTSDLFRKSRAWAERFGSIWFVLSAKHGLLPPDAVIEPYDVTLSTMSPVERNAWSRTVSSQWDTTVWVGPVVVLAGLLYRDWIAGRGFDVPMAGLGIGQQKSWLKHRLEVPSR